MLSEALLLPSVAPLAQRVQKYVPSAQNATERKRDPKENTQEVKNE